MSGLRAGEYQNSRFNSSLIANRLVLEAIIPKLETKVEDIIDLVVSVIDPIVDNFFHDLATHMGSQLDLVSQVPIPGGRPWNPLSLDYLRKKNNSLFWTYTNTIYPQFLAYRLGTRLGSKKFKQAQADALIPTFKRISGLKAFGGATVRITQSVGDELQVGTKRLRERVGAKGTRQTIRVRAVPQMVEALNIKFSVRLWSNFARSRIPTIETALVENGTFNALTAKKLIGKTQGGARRPLTRPFMAYYSTVLIPKAVQDAINQRFTSHGQIRVLPP